MLSTYRAPYHTPDTLSDPSTNNTTMEEEITTICCRLCLSIGVPSQLQRNRTAIERPPL
jgi:hypothetical protein